MTSASASVRSALGRCTGAVVAVTALTFWAYSRRLKGPAAAGAMSPSSLRLLALLLCLLAALRPSVCLNEKKKQDASLVVLVDTSTSMNIGDEVRGQTRWDVATQVRQAGEGFAKTLGPDLDVKFYRFDSKLAEPKAGELVEEPKPTGRETALGSAMHEAQKRTGKHLAPAGPARDPLGFRQQQRRRPARGRPPLEGPGRAGGHRRPGNRKRRGGSPRYQAARHRRRPDRFREEPARRARHHRGHGDSPARRWRSSCSSRARRRRSQKPGSRSPKGPT